MKKLATLLLAAAMFCALLPQAWAADDPDAPYLESMIKAAAAADMSAGAGAEKARNENIDALGLDKPRIAFHDLWLLAKLIYAEAGSSWLSEEWKFCVGEVVMNRVASPEFPNTIEEVIYQRGQYYGRRNRYFASIVPGKTEARIAARLLCGERHMKSSVVFQANFPQGSGTYLRLRDRILGSTYLCVSSRPKLYKA